MAEKLAVEVDPSVEFLYKTMLQRDPRKRKVKPVQRHLIQVDFGGGDDSEDDSDFDVEKHHRGSEDSDGGEESEKDDNLGNESEDETDDDDDSDSSSDEDENEDVKPSTSSMAVEVKQESITAVETATKVETGSDLIPKTEFPMATLTTKHKQIKVTICCVCLGDISEEDDEIVECDNCGVSVHEGCYGISENQSTASTESSASTEPWFCDACKAGCKPTCELCPNPGGIFKETDAGKWVHLVCALYTPGVAFGDVDKLSPVTLFEMPYSRWGARECSLCEDARFSRTGVCITCDAGMCRTYFHVTCAQKEGLLSEAAPEECLEIADPFFAYCKMHADKMTSRAKRRNWLAIQSHIRHHSEKILEDEKEKTRFDRKLNRHRQKYNIAKSKRPPSWVPTQKLVRYLTSSPSCVKKMLRKAELMGIITQVQHVTEEKQEIRKKTHTAPALSVEFISYYLERNGKIENIKTTMKDILEQNNKLQDQEKILRRQYDQRYEDVHRLRESSNKLKKEGERMYGLLSDMASKMLPLPELFGVKKTPVKQTVSRRDSAPCTSPPAIIQQCAVCRKTNNPHLLVKCDLCKKHYHLGCLDPPLTRMPKKTKLQGWQCSECDPTSSEEEEGTHEDVNAPRKLREKIKEPFKWSPDIKFEFEKLTKYSMKGSKSRKKKKKHSVSNPKTEQTASSGSANKAAGTSEEKEGNSGRKRRQSNRSTPAKKAKEDDISNDADCVVCNKKGDGANMVKCDECKLCYHFGCLDPPMKKSPKQRGYSWHCEACDPTDDSEDEDMEDDSSEKADEKMDD